VAYLVGGVPAEIDVSASEAVLATNRYHDTFWSFRQEMPVRPGYGFSSTNRVAPCRDGWVSIAASTQGQWEMLCVLMEMEDLLVDPRMQTPLERLANTVEIGERMDAWLLQHHKWEIFHQAQSLRVPIGPILFANEARDCDQFESRDVFRGADGTTTELPARFGLLERCGLGASASRSESTDIPRPRLSGAGTTSPLAGRRVVEVVSWWAGPIVGRILAMLGADVIKVESPLYPDPWRYLYCEDRTDLLYETSPLFSGGNPGKRSVGLDSSKPAGRRLLFDLISTADILVQNLSPAAADRLGLTGPELGERSPGLVRLSVSGFGMSGPWRNYLSFAAIGDGLAGVTAAMRYEENGHPLYQGSVIGDSITGYHAAFLALAAVYAREHHGGHGQTVDVAQSETLLSLMLAELAAPSLYKFAVGNGSPDYVLQRCVQTAGDDQWIAISIRDDAELLRAVASLQKPGAGPEPADDPTTRLEMSLRSRSKYDAFQALQGAGIAACPVLSPAEVLADPQFLSRSAHVSLDHPITGKHPYVALGARANGETLAVKTPAPLFGEHTRAIVRSLAISDEDVQQLFEKAVLSDHPFNEGPSVGA
jgi:crotonobetainyl-CoA:carnitine CoA-transferase CaiB-like acyl-CoA transferase